MEDQGYPSKRQRADDQPRRKKRSHALPPASSPSPQLIDPTFPQGYEVASPLLDQVQVEYWGDYGAATMDWELDTSEKYRSISSPATTYINADTPSVAFTDHLGGYIMVKDPSSGAHSNGSGSNQTSGRGSEEGPYYSPPFSPDTDFHLDTGPMQDFHLVPHAHNQQQMLSGLGTQKPQQMFESYEQYAASSSGYQDIPENYTYETSQTESSSQNPKPQDNFPGPWNHQTALRVPRYSSGYVAFGLTPEPEPEEDVSSPRRTSRPTQKKPSGQSAKLAPEPRRKEKSVSPGYENVVVEKGRFTFVPEGYSDVAPQSGRKGGLGKEAKKKAAAIRKAKACWNCWLLKVPCSEGKTCERCLKFTQCSKNTPSTHLVCSRFGFKDFEASFFPGLLCSHLTKGEVESLISKDSAGFIGTPFTVYVTTGSAFMSLELETYFFEPLGWALCEQHHLTLKSEEGKSDFLMRFAAPVGIMFLSKSDLRKSLRKHIEEMVSNELYTAQVAADDANKVPKAILDVILQYAKSTDNSLVKSALMLHAMHYFMATLITFTDDSAMNVYSSSPSFSVPPEPFLSSRLLNRQLKFVMHRIHRDLTSQVLEGLEKSMRSRTKDAWGPCFATILILSLCIEGLQTAADIFVVCDRKKDGGMSVCSREQSRAACRDVEEYTYDRCTHLFHEIFKTSKIQNGARDGGINPLRALERDRETGLDRKADNMARKIHELCRSSYGTLEDLAEHPALLEYEGRDPEPEEIKNNNTGRLAAKFLMSFFGRKM